jgi:hypothetical protein
MPRLDTADSGSRLVLDVADFAPMFDVTPAGTPVAGRCVRT